MAYLLFSTTEIPAARRKLFRDAYKELKKIVLDEQQGEEDEKNLTITMTIVKRIMNQEGSSMVLDAWGIAKELIDFVDKDRMG